MSKHEITIRWVASDRAKVLGLETVSLTFDLFYEDLSPFDLLETLFAQTNQYKGHIWDAIEDRLPLRRSHTALSVGDEVSIDGAWFECDHIGWKNLEEPTSLLPWEVEILKAQEAHEESFKEGYSAGWNACIERLNRDLGYIKQTPAVPTLKETK
jgi:hypothetical protein